MNRPRHDSPIKLAFAAIVGAGLLWAGCWGITLIGVALGIAK